MQVRVTVPKVIAAEANYLGKMTRSTIPEVLGKQLIWLHNSYTLQELQAIVSSINLEVANEPMFDGSEPGKKGV